MTLRRVTKRMRYRKCEHDDKSFRKKVDEKIVADTVVRHFSFRAYCRSQLRRNV